MIRRILFGTPKLELLKQALEAYALRGRVLARNVANADTPGYRAREVRFEQDLRRALRSPVPEQGAATPGRHLPLPGSGVRPRVVLRNASSPWTSSGVNDVDIDREMAEITENSLRYTVAAELARRAYRGIREAIRGRTIG